MNINERIRDLRKSLKLSQEEFGNRLGVTKASISRLESGINNVTEQMIKSVCREYNVNYAWLKEGIGEMFVSSDDSVANRIDDLLAGENETAKALFRAFAVLNDADWEVVQKVINELKKD